MKWSALKKQQAKKAVKDCIYAVVQAAAVAGHHMHMLYLCNGK
jgi:hypothetical protein